MLQLYRKAQTESLDAQDISWIEQTTREHPYFGLAYQISARHHLSEKTTVKDRALLVGAAYALDRKLLHSYVSDTLVAPKQAKAVSLVQVPLKEEEAAPPVVEEEVVAAISEEKAEAVVEPVLEMEVAAEPTEEGLAPEIPVAVQAHEKEAEVEIAETVIELPLAEVVTPTIPVADAIPSEQPSVEEKEAEQAYVSVPINWFLNMRIKLRAAKLQAMAPKLRASIGQFAAKADAPSKGEMPLAIESAAVEPVHAVMPIAAIVQPLVSEKEVPKEVAESGSSGAYSIGAFSSFTFLRESDTSDIADPEHEGLVMEPDTMTVEASLPDEAAGEIIFEEDGRIVEIVVSAELRERFFNGRLPLDFIQEHKEIPSALSPQPEEGVAGLDKEGRKKKASQLIDQFIEVDPTMSRGKFSEGQNQDLGKKSNHDRDDFVTETLAKIYAQQGNKSKAIKIYQKLSLLFPEKKDYFAARIADLK